jgi:retron-type reverse transcriptase
VQKAMCLLLELIYEPELSQFSHGFRPNRGCHTAMSQVSKWSGTQWAIEGDIKGFFDNVNHQLLATLIQKKIGDQQFIDLYWKLVKAGYVEEGVKKDSPLAGRGLAVAWPWFSSGSAKEKVAIDGGLVSWPWPGPW